MGRSNSVKTLFSALFAASLLFTGAGVRRPAVAAENGPFRQDSAEQEDTLYLYRHTYRANGHTEHCRIYVERDRNSESWRRLMAGTSLGEWDRQEDMEGWLSLYRKRHPGPLARHDRKGCPEVWLPLVRVGGTYYLDGGVYNYPCRITDSLVVWKTMDGAFPEVIESYEEPERGHYRIFISSTASDDKSQLDVYLLREREKRFAVFARKERGEVGMQLFVPCDEASEFDLLVWDFTELPMGNEVIYDRIDYRKLIEDAKYESE